jgi:hypothetical protein
MGVLFRALWRSVYSNSGRAGEEEAADQTHHAATARAPQPCVAVWVGAHRHPLAMLGNQAFQATLMDFGGVTRQTP